MIKLYKYTQREKEESNMYDIKTGVEFYIKDVVEKVYEVPRN